MSESSPQQELTIETSRFGQITVAADKVITLPQGMVGFPQQRRYVLLQHRPGSPLHWLQSLDRGDLAFVVVTPLLFDPQYKLALGRTETEMLKVEDPAQIQVWVVVTIPHGHPEQMTGNLRAPLVINLANRLGTQVILEDPSYSLRKPLVQPETA